MPEHLPPLNIVIDIDQYTYIGSIEREFHNIIPSWMQPHRPQDIADHFFFIRTELGSHYQGTLQKTTRPGEFNSDIPGPVIAEIHLEDGQFFTAHPFEKYPMPTRRHSIYEPFLPAGNRLYVSTPGGLVYFATLKPHTSVYW